MNRITLLAMLAFTVSAEDNWTRLYSDEQIIFYPSVAQRVKGKTNLWKAEIRGCVFEVEKRALMVTAFEEALELKMDDLTADESIVFGERARLFLVDHERGKKVFVTLGTNTFFVGKSSADGRFTGEVVFTASSGVPGDPLPGFREMSLSFQANLPATNLRSLAGAVFPLEETGVSVISDIDDTIKITEVRDRQATLRNTFLREFRAVPGMAEFYQLLARSNGAAFHYISASPWQLYEPLAGLVSSNGFPAGTFELKPFRWKGRSALNLFSDPEKYKPGVIEPLLKRFPQRKVILVGDSGERDPEVYGALARKFPKQILRIYIRDVTNEAAETERYEKAFRELPVTKWQIFREPTELRGLTADDLQTNADLSH